MILKKKSIYKLFILGFILIFTAGCGRKGPPVPPEIKKIDKVTQISIKQENSKMLIFWDHLGEVDYFKLQIAEIECESCPANYIKLGKTVGTKKYFEFSGYKPGIYKIKITAVSGRNESEPEVEKFTIE